MSTNDEGQNINDKEQVNVPEEEVVDTSSAQGGGEKKAADVLVEQENEEEMKELFLGQRQIQSILEKHERGTLEIDELFEHFLDLHSILGDAVPVDLYTKLLDIGINDIDEEEKEKIKEDTLSFLRELLEKGYKPVSKEDQNYKELYNNYIKRIEAFRKIKQKLEEFGDKEFANDILWSMELSSFFNLLAKFNIGWGTASSDKFPFGERELELKKKASKNRFHDDLSNKEEREKEILSFVREIVVYYTEDKIRELVFGKD